MFDYETLKLIWWLLVGVLLVGFAIMDGHDTVSYTHLDVYKRQHGSGSGRNCHHAGVAVVSAIFGSRLPCPARPGSHNPLIQIVFLNSPAMARNLRIRRKK